MTNKERVDNAVLSMREIRDGLCDVVPVSLAFELVKELEEAQRLMKVHQDIKEAEKKILIQEIQNRVAIELALCEALDMLMNRYAFGKTTPSEETFLRKHGRIK